MKTALIKKGKRKQEKPPLGPLEKDVHAVQEKSRMMLELNGPSLIQVKRGRKGEKGTARRVQPLFEGGGERPRSTNNREREHFKR